MRSMVFLPLLRLSVTRKEEEEKKGSGGCAWLVRLGRLMLVV